MIFKIQTFLTLLVPCLFLLSPPVSLSGEEVLEQKENPEPGIRLTRVKLGGYHFGDSGDFIHRHGGLWGKFHLTRSRYLEADFNHHWVSQRGDQCAGNDVGFLLGDMIRPGWEGNLGVRFVNYEGIGVNFSYRASLALKPTKKSHLTLKYEHDNVVYKVSRIDALKKEIESDEFSSSLYQSISQRWSFWGRVTLGRYSDRNFRSCLEPSFTYMLKHDPACSFTYALYYLTYTERSDHYWDPPGYLGHLLILGLKKEIGGLFSLNLKGSIAFSPSDKKRPNPGLSIRLALPNSARWGLDVTGEFRGDGSRGENYSYGTASVNVFYLP